MSQDDHGKPKGLVAGIIGLSIGALAGQILLVRVFSYTMNHGFVYMAVSLAMLGFGVSGTLLALFPSLKKAAPHSSLALCALGFSVSLVVSMSVFGRFSSMADPQSGLSLWSPLAARLILLALPFMFAGLGIALALLSHQRGVGLRYGWNLAGSGAGCLVAYPLLVSSGAEGGILALAALVCFMGAWSGRGTLRVILMIAALPCAGAVPFASLVLQFQPDGADQFADLVKHIEEAGFDTADVELEYSAWDPVGRIEVHSLPGEYGSMNREAPLRFYSQDAGAGSVLLSLTDHPKLRDSLARGTLYGLAGRFKPRSEALVIGIGGAPDLIALLAGSCRKLDAVEINGATVDMVGQEQDGFLGLTDDIETGRLVLHHADGRGFVRSRREAFDIIQMTGADTYAANPAGASILSEGYLYTEEAFADYLRALRPGGIVAVTRFGIESARVFNTALAALEKAGVEHPKDHLMVVAQGSSDFWSMVIVGRDPFTDADIARIDELCKEGAPLAKNCWIPAYNAVGFRFDSPLQLTFHSRLPIDLEQMKAKLEGDVWKLDPVTDDKPFFFQFKKREGVGWKEVFDGGSFNKHHWDLPDYLRIAIQVSFVALLLILLPLVRLGFGGAGWRESMATGTGFAALGAGFMFLEVVLMQRCTLFLGHPNHAIVIVLFSLLLASGLGAFLSGTLPLRRSLLVGAAIAGICIWIIAFSLNAQSWFESRLELSLWSRAVQLQIWLLPLGLLLGMPFPAFLSALEEQRPSLSGWAWGVNSFASVCASLIAIPLTMQRGFASSFHVALACYVLALLAFLAFLVASRRGLGPQA